MEEVVVTEKKSSSSCGSSSSPNASSTLVECGTPPTTTTTTSAEAGTPGGGAVLLPVTEGSTPDNNTMTATRGGGACLSRAPSSLAGDVESPRTPPTTIATERSLSNLQIDTKKDSKTAAGEPPVKVFSSKGGKSANDDSGKGERSASLDKTTGESNSSFGTQHENSESLGNECDRRSGNASTSKDSMMNGDRSSNTPTNTLSERLEKWGGCHTSSSSRSVSGEGRVEKKTESQEERSRFERENDARHDRHEIIRSNTSSGNSGSLRSGYNKSVDDDGDDDDMTGTVMSSMAMCLSKSKSSSSIGTKYGSLNTADDMEDDSRSGSNSSAEEDSHISSNRNKKRESADITEISSGLHLYDKDTYCCSRGPDILFRKGGEGKSKSSSRSRSSSSTTGSGTGTGTITTIIGGAAGRGAETPRSSSNTATTITTTRGSGISGSNKDYRFGVKKEITVRLSDPKMESNKTFHMTNASSSSFSSSSSSSTLSFSSASGSSDKSVHVNISASAELSAACDSQTKKSTSSCTDMSAGADTPPRYHGGPNNMKCTSDMTPLHEKAPSAQTASRPAALVSTSPRPSGERDPADASGSAGTLAYDPVDNAENRHFNGKIYACSTAPPSLEVIRARLQLRPCTSSNNEQNGGPSRLEATTTTAHAGPSLAELMLQQEPQRDAGSRTTSASSSSKSSSSSSSSSGSRNGSSRKEESLVPALAPSTSVITGNTSVSCSPQQPQQRLIPSPLTTNVTCNEKHDFLALPDDAPSNTVCVAAATASRPATITSSSPSSSSSSSSFSFPPPPFCFRSRQMDAHAASDAIVAAAAIMQNQLLLCSGVVTSTSAPPPGAATTTTTTTVFPTLVGGGGGAAREGAGGGRSSLQSVSQTISSAADDTWTTALLSQHGSMYEERNRLLLRALANNATTTLSDNSSDSTSLSMSGDALSGNHPPPLTATGLHASQVRTNTTATATTNTTTTTPPNTTTTTATGNSNEAAPNRIPGLVSFLSSLHRQQRNNNEDLTRLLPSDRSGSSCTGICAPPCRSVVDHANGCSCSTTVNTMALSTTTTPTNTTMNNHHAKNLIRKEEADIVLGLIYLAQALLTYMEMIEQHRQTAIEEAGRLRRCSKELAAMLQQANQREELSHAELRRQRQLLIYCREQLVTHQTTTQTTIEELTMERQSLSDRLKLVTRQLEQKARENASLRREIETQRAALQECQIVRETCASLEREKKHLHVELEALRISSSKAINEKNALLAEVHRLHAQIGDMTVAAAAVASRLARQQNQHSRSIRLASVCQEVPLDAEEMTFTGRCQRQINPCDTCGSRVIDDDDVERDPLLHGTSVNANAEQDRRRDRGRCGTAALEDKSEETEQEEELQQKLQQELQQKVQQQEKGQGCMHEEEESLEEEVRSQSPPLSLDVTAIAASHKTKDGMMTSGGGVPRNNYTITTTTRTEEAAAAASAVGARGSTLLPVRSVPAFSSAGRALLPAPAHATTTANDEEIDSDLCEVRELLQSLLLPCVSAASDETSNYSITDDVVAQTASADTEKEMHTSEDQTARNHQNRKKKEEEKEHEEQEQEQEQQQQEEEEPKQGRRQQRKKEGAEAAAKNREAAVHRLLRIFDRLRTEKNEFHGVGPTQTDVVE